MKRLDKTKSPIFVLLCILWSQRQRFRFLFNVGESSKFSLMLGGRITVHTCLVSRLSSHVLKNKSVFFFVCVCFFFVCFFFFFVLFFFFFCLFFFFFFFFFFLMLKYHLN